MNHTIKWYYQSGRVLNLDKSLQPERTLLRIETNKLKISDGRAPVTVDDAYQMILGKYCSVEQYHVYSWLNWLGYYIVRCPNVDVNTKLKICKKKSKQQINSYGEVRGKKRPCDEDEVPEVIEKKQKLSDDKNEIFDFPRFIGKARVYVPIPPSHLLPPNVVISYNVCFKTQPKFTKDKRSFVFGHANDDDDDDDNECYPKIFPTGISARSWSEFKDKINKLNSNCDEPTTAVVASNPPQNLTESAEEALDEESFDDEPLEEEPLEKKPNTNDDSVVSYDAFIPHSNRWEKRTLGRLAVTHFRESKTNFYDFYTRAKKTGVSHSFAISDCGQISIHSLKWIKMCKAKCSCNFC